MDNQTKKVLIITVVVVIGVIFTVYLLGEAGASEDKTIENSHLVPSSIVSELSFQPIKYNRPWGCYQPHWNAAEVRRADYAAVTVTWRSS